LTSIMTGVSYATSAEMAEELGPFPGFTANREAMLRVIRNHRRAAHGERGGYEALSIPPVPLEPPLPVVTSVEPPVPAEPSVEKSKGWL